MIRSNFAKDKAIKAVRQAALKKTIRIPRTKIWRVEDTRVYLTKDGIQEAKRLIDRVTKLDEMTHTHREMIAGCKLCQLETVEFLIYNDNNKTGYALRMKQMKELIEWHSSGM